MGGSSVCPASQAAAAQPTVSHASLGGDLCKDGLLLQRSPLPWCVWDRSLLATPVQALWLVWQWQVATGATGSKSKAQCIVGGDNWLQDLFTPKGPAAAAAVMAEQLTQALTW